jgi:hypothetical protein
MSAIISGKPPKRIPGKRVIWISGRPVVMSDKDYRDFVGASEKKFKHKKRERL